jgi:hypothetical protein
MNSKQYKQIYQRESIYSEISNTVKFVNALKICFNKQMRIEVKSLILMQNDAFSILLYFQRF